MPGACFGAHVRVAARQGRQRASSPAPKNNTIPTGWCFFAFAGRAEARTGHERSERNMPGACFGARVRVAVRQGRQRASSPAPKRNTILQDGVSLHLPGRRRCAHRHAGSTKAPYCYDAFVLLGRRRKGNAIPLSVVLFLFPYNRCANGCTAADKQQGNPQSRAACVAGLG